MSGTKTFRVDARLRNNLLIKAREALGFTSAASAAKALELPYPAIVQYEALSKSPWGKKGWNPSAVVIANAYKVLPEMLWPNEIDAVKKTKVSMEIDTPAAFLEAPRTPEERLLEADRVDTIQRALELLPTRDRQILSARFGFDGKEMLLSEIGEALGVCRSRAQQLEERAKDRLRRLLKSNGEPVRDLNLIEAEQTPPTGPKPVSLETEYEHENRLAEKEAQIKGWRKHMKERYGYSDAEIAEIEKRENLNRMTADRVR